MTELWKMNSMWLRVNDCIEKRRWKHDSSQKETRHSHRTLEEAQESLGSGTSEGGREG